ncbi:SMI1/KNR4 family protein [Pseudoalteromonas sp. PPB1]|uniref:SMI1/KNR4 family protein n=1 Tax=Pseudoalteromonas sp. PPB1 TaxID=2756136 RepID=UPI001890F8AC|nr:SMI1/KNR4 family protein [Pseudoalteromonas sp. PPB1]
MKLSEMFPDGEFSEPASEANFSEVEEALSAKIPDQLRELLLETDGFREGTGNAKYLFSLTDEDFIGSILSVTKFMWSNETLPDLTPFIFFGSSCGDNLWGVRINEPHDVIAYHHNMEDEYEMIGNDIYSVFQEDYKIYDEL